MCMGVNNGAQIHRSVAVSFWASLSPTLFIYISLYNPIYVIFCDICGDKSNLINS